MLAWAVALEVAPDVLHAMLPAAVWATMGGRWRQVIVLRASLWGRSAKGMAPRWTLRKSRLADRRAFTGRVIRRWTESGYADAYVGSYTLYYLAVDDGASAEAHVWRVDPTRYREFPRGSDVRVTVDHKQRLVESRCTCRSPAQTGRRARPARRSQAAAGGGPPWRRSRAGRLAASPALTAEPRPPRPAVPRHRRPPSRRRETRSPRTRAGRRASAAPLRSPVREPLGAYPASPSGSVYLPPFARRHPPLRPAQTAATLEPLPEQRLRLQSWW